MGRRAFLTPDFDGNAPLICRRLALPSFLWQYFNGAFGALIHDYNWEEFGDMPIDDIVQVYINALTDMEEVCMIGSVVPFATKTLPDNVLLCDGSSHLVADYPRLAEVLPNVLVTAPTFIVPDLRGRFVMGGDDGFAWPITLQGGATEHTLTVSEMPAHSHGYTSAIASVSTVVIPDEPSAIPSPATTSPEGGGQPHNNLPPFYVLEYGIVAK